MRAHQHDAGIDGSEQRLGQARSARERGQRGAHAERWMDLVLQHSAPTLAEPNAAPENKTLNRTLIVQCSTWLSFLPGGPIGGTVGSFPSFLPRFGREFGDTAMASARAR